MTDTVQQSQAIDDTAQDDAAVTRLAVRMALAGFGLMFIAGAFMWLNFGPAIFVDLATAVVNCFSPKTSVSPVRTLPAAVTPGAFAAASPTEVGIGE